MQARKTSDYELTATAAAGIGAVIATVSLLEGNHHDFSFYLLLSSTAYFTAAAARVCGLDKTLDWAGNKVLAAKDATCTTVAPLVVAAKDATCNAAVSVKEMVSNQYSSFFSSKAAEKAVEATVEARDSKGVEEVKPRTRRGN